MVDVILICQSIFVRVSNVHHHNTRGSCENFLAPSVNGTATTTFNYNNIKDWNSLPLEIKTTSDFNSFKDAAKICLRFQLQLMEADNFIFY